jgi:hypothetical protein
MTRFPVGKSFFLGNVLGAIFGAAAVIYARPRIPAILWWLFGAGE